MTLSRTLALIKPDAFDRNLSGKIIEHALDSGLRIIAIKSVKLNRKQVESFYDVHKDRPFFSSLVEYMTSSTTVAIILEGPNAVDQWRTIMGATNPSEALEGTIRKQFAESVERNCCHGSDSNNNALKEIGFFFNRQELL